MTCSIGNSDDTGRFKPFALSLDAIQHLQEIRFSQNGPEAPPVWEVSIVNSGNCSGPNLHIPVRKLAFVVCRRIHLPFGNRMEIRIPPDRASKLLAVFCSLHIFPPIFPFKFSQALLNADFLLGACCGSKSMKDENVLILAGPV